ncbi:MAG: hypothetical protein H6750_04295 [Nitrospiraceae bacterium]|nr:hypothetical protein [Nitrospira sp.]MCB9773528.1 hypothetical protein [Nitrospiraceae bacterium]
MCEEISSHYFFPAKRPNAYGNLLRIFVWMLGVDPSLDVGQLPIVNGLTCGGSLGVG